MKRAFLSTIGVVLVFAGVSRASPTLQTVLGTPAPAIEASGQNLVGLIDTDQSSVATLLLEAAGFRNSNVFGMYSPNDAGEKLLLFAGADTPTQSVEVVFDLDNQTATNVSTGRTADIGSVFGFYLISPDGTFYTEKSLNSDGAEHGLLFDTRAYAGLIYGNPDTVVAFEDMQASSPWQDWDYNDMVVGVTNATPVVVPSPSAVVLTWAGISLVGYLRRRRTL